ncbi:MAG TPA: hypothetical protein VII24_06015 [Pseudolabrys sp.]|jgi:hypothetical protein
MINRVFCALAAVLAAGLFSAPAAAQTVESAYTALDLDKCRHTPSKEEEDYGEWRCSGYGGIAVHVSAGDQRSYVSYGRNAKNEPAAKQTLASFNGEGEKIEWRAERGADGKLKPFATIMRWSTTVSSGDAPVRGEMLVVTRLGPGGVCHVGYVDGKANPDANALAQKLADDHARKFRCGADKPIVLGNKGPGFSGPYDR